jgi:hypothetical protein
MIDMLRSSMDAAAIAEEDRRRFDKALDFLGNLHS